jgi:predicted DNA-binding transcriptional regulator AlpA
MSARARVRTSRNTARQAAGDGPAPAPPDFITLIELAHHMGVSTDTIGDWVKAGHWPREWASVGRTKVWRRDHYEHFRATGKWPAESAAKGRAK